MQQPDAAPPRRAGPGTPPPAKPSKAQDVPPGPGPLGQGEHVVKPGDCIASIAKATGHAEMVIWGDGGNAAVSAGRANRNILLPGDKIVIPKQTLKQENGETENRHRFRKNGEPATLQLKFTDFEQPRAGLQYKLTVDDGEPQSGVTDAGGMVIADIPPNARKAVLLLYPENKGTERYEMELGTLNPPTEYSGLKRRLNNLGYPCGSIDENLDEKTRRALFLFQVAHDLDETHQMDEPTRAEIMKQYCC